LAEAGECLIQEDIGDPDEIRGLGTDRVRDAAGRMSSSSHKILGIAHDSVPVMFASRNRVVGAATSIASWALRDGDGDFILTRSWVQACRNSSFVIELIGAQLKGQKVQGTSAKPLPES
jgi:hypothetical protein